MTVKLKKLWKNNLDMVVLMIATFFNPLGFDALFAFVMKLTGSFWITDAIFYALSGTFFMIYFFLKRNKAKNQKA